MTGFGKFLVFNFYIHTKFFVTFVTEIKFKKIQIIKGIRKP